MAEAILTTKREAAEQLRISIRHLENLIKRENLPIVRLGRSVRIPSEAIHQLAQRGAA